MTHDNETPEEIYVSKATAKVLAALPASDTIKYTRTPPPPSGDAVELVDGSGLDDGPELPLRHVMAWKKPLIIKAWQEGLSLRSVGKIFDVSHETVAQVVKFERRALPAPPVNPPSAERVEALDALVVQAQELDMGYDNPALSAPVDTGWMPIETAPRDGTWIMTTVKTAMIPAIVRWVDFKDWGSDFEGLTARWLDDEQGCGLDNDALYDHIDNSSYEPTHWRPLPAPPVKQKLYGRG